MYAARGTYFLRWHTFSMSFFYFFPRDDSENNNPFRSRVLPLLEGNLTLNGCGNCQDNFVCMSFYQALGLLRKAKKYLNRCGF